MKDTYNDGYKAEDIKCIIVDVVAEDGKGGLPIMRQGIYVLCKDCKYYRDNVGECEYVWEHQGVIVDVLADDFCSRGEKNGS